MPLPYITLSSLDNQFVLISHKYYQTGMMFDIPYDQLIVVNNGWPEEKWDGQHPISLRFFNKDGSEANMCGNGSRAAGRYFLDQAGLNTLIFHTKGGDVTVTIVDKAHTAVWMQIPLVNRMAEGTYYLPFPHLATYQVDAGNNHWVITLPYQPLVDLLALVRQWQDFFAPLLTTFNVGFVSVYEGEIQLVVIERGAGMTQACGSGAMAAAAILFPILQPQDHHLTVIQQGGQVIIQHDLLTQTYGQIGPCGPQSSIYYYEI